MPDPGPCACGDGHEHSDFDPFACAEPDCRCTAHHDEHVVTFSSDRCMVCGDGDDEPEPDQNAAQIASNARNRAAVTIPANALDFSQQRVTQAAEHLNDILSHHQTLGNPHEPLAVLGLADLLENTWPDGIDPLDVLALTIRRLQDATAPRDTSARRFVTDVRRRIERQRR